MDEFQQMYLQQEQMRQIQEQQMQDQHRFSEEMFRQAEQNHRYTESSFGYPTNREPPDDRESGREDSAWRYRMEQQQGNPEYHVVVRSANREEAEPSRKKLYVIGILSVSMIVIIIALFLLCL